MAAIHEALYRTGKYLNPGAFTFEFKATTWGNGNETSAYNLPEGITNMSSQITKVCSASLIAFTRCAISTPCSVSFTAIRCSEPTTPPT